STSGNWSSAATWGGAGVPGAGDTATVNSGHTVTLDGPVTVSTLNQAGNINGAQTLGITSAFTWTSGTMSGASTTTLPGLTTTTINGGVTLDGRTLANGGTLNFTSSNYIYMQNNASLNNGGTIDFQGDGGIYPNGAVGTMTVTNSGA